MDSDNLPPLTSDPVAEPKTPTPLPNAPMDEQKNLSLMPDQLAALGLDGIAPGKTYTIQIKSMGDDGGGDPAAPQNFEVISADEDAGPGDSGAAPSDAEIPGGDDDQVPPPIGDENDSYDEDDKVLGFKRSKKPKRDGLPDTKKMRDL